MTENHELPTRRASAAVLLSLSLALGAGCASAPAPTAASSAAPTAAAEAKKPAAAYNMIAAADLKKRLEAGDKPMLLDIQVEADFAKHHLPGAVATYAYPVKTDEQRARLMPSVRQILAGKEDVVIVCPAGGGGARDTYDLLKAQGVAESRLRILEKGQKGWPYAEMVTAESR